MTGRIAKAPAQELESFDAFAAALADRFGVTGAERWRPEDRLDLHLPWDSLAQVEVTEWLDGLGVLLPPDLLPEIISIGDLHHYASSPATAQVGASTSARPPMVHLAPVDRADEQALFQIFTAGHHLTRFRLRGTTPSPDVFHLQLWERVLAQFAVRTVPGGPVVGLVSAFDPDLRNRHVHLAAVAHPHLVGSGAVARAAVQLVDHLFTVFDFRKVYAEALESNLENFRSGIGQWFDVEGRLRGHEFVDGRYEDLLIISTTRERWVERRPPH